MSRTWLGLLLLLIAPAGLAAEVRLPAVFSDHMVLQQQMPLTVWGRAEPGERVEVRFRAQRVAAVADGDGRWQVTLAPEAAGGPDTLTVAGSGAPRELTDVLVGEVWIASGQSNMQWAVRQALDAEREIAAASHPRMRLFSVTRRTAPAAPLEEVPAETGWQVASPASIPEFSAVGYFFARELQRARDVPVGIVHSSWGGTPAEAWTSRETLERDPALQPLLWQYRRLEAEYPAAAFQHELRLPIYTEAVKARRAQFPDAPPPPGLAGPRGGPSDPHRPGALWNAMIAPLTRFAVRGAIWYQGETNAVRAWDYHRLFTAMIQDWRRAWGRGDFPFLFVQLANFRPNPPTPGTSWWSAVREAQRLTLALPNTAMASAIDIGDPLDIHPLNKQEVGRRLALAARAVAYGERVVHAGPLYDGMAIEGARIRLRFRHTGTGLVLDTSKSSGFTIAGADGQFRRAVVTVDGDTVLVSSPDVPAPVAVRYAWEDDPVTSLRNREGLPASPFRTDGY